MLGGHPLVRVKSLDPSTLTPGRERVWLELLSGDQVSAGYIPVEVAKAEVEGPTVAIVAAIHGDELNGTATVQQVSRLLNERPLVAGTLMMIPVLNLHGFGTRQRWFMDNRDLNREMASPVELTPMFQKPSQRFGERLLRRLIDHVDYLLDLHTATTGYTNGIYARVDTRHPRAAELAAALSPPVIVNKPPPDGSLRAAAQAMAVPVVTLELGSPLGFEAHIVTDATAAVMRALAKLGLIAGDDEVPETVMLTSTRWLRAMTQGLATVHVKPGDQVEKGQTLATVVDFWGDQLEDVTTPVPGVVLGHIVHPQVYEGTRVVHLGINE